MFGLAQTSLDVVRIIVWGLRILFWRNLEKETSLEISEESSSG